jgi:hypothetical protein
MKIIMAAMNIIKEIKWSKVALATLCASPEGYPDGI